MKHEGRLGGAEQQQLYQLGTQSAYQMGERSSMAVIAYLHNADDLSSLCHQVKNFFLKLSCRLKVTWCTVTELLAPLRN